MDGRSKFSEEKYKDLRTQVGYLYKEMSLKAIAKQLNISHRMARKMFAETGLTPRPPGAISPAERRRQLELYKSMRI